MYISLPVSLFLSNKTVLKIVCYCFSYTQLVWIFCRIFVFSIRVTYCIFNCTFCVSKACSIFVFFCRLNSVLIHGDSSVLVWFFWVWEINFNILFRVDKSNMFFFLCRRCRLHTVISLRASELQQLHRRVAEWHPGDCFL